MIISRYVGNSNEEGRIWGPAKGTKDTLTAPARMVALYCSKRAITRKRWRSEWCEAWLGCIDFRASNETVPNNRSPSVPSGPATITSVAELCIIVANAVVSPKKNCHLRLPRPPLRPCPHAHTCRAHLLPRLHSSIPTCLDD